jgi:putative tryptophan/tyrosine transport system substrate-binding protein
MARPVMARAVPAVLAALALLVTPPLAGEAQQAGKVYRIGYLGSTSRSSYQAPLVEALRQALHRLGYVEGKNLVIDYRWAEGKYERLPDLASELVGLKVDVIVTHGTPGSLAARQATTTIPIVMAISGDAVATGLVTSIARPGGNLTGSTFFFPELNAKRLELLKEAVPRASRIAAFVNADNPSSAPALKAMESRAASLKVDLAAVQVRRVEDFAGAFSAMVKQGVDGLVLIDDPMVIAHARQLVDLTAKNRIPAIGFTEYAHAGGLMAYAVNLAEGWRRAAVFVDKILKGAKPGELPIEQATRFDFAVNLKTAKALGLTIPQPLLIRADEVIQ